MSPVGRSQGAPPAKAAEEVKPFAEEGGQPIVCLSLGLSELENSTLKVQANNEIKNKSIPKSFLSFNIKPLLLFTRVLSVI